MQIWLKTILFFCMNFFGFMCDYYVAFISALVLLKCGNLRITVVSKNSWGSPPGAAIYGMCNTSIHFVVLHKFL